MRSVVAFTSLLVLGLAVSCSNHEAPAPYRPAIEVAGDRGAMGRDLYLRDCAWCHGPDAQGTAYGGPLTDVSDKGAAAFDFVMSTGRMPLVSPDDEMERSEPSYTPEEITAIVDYARTITTGPDVPGVDPESGDLAIGAELYIANCAQCHSATGTGSVLTGAVEIPDVYEVDGTQIAEAMVTGPGHMPVFGPETFDQHERDSLIRYTLELKGNNRGGWAIARLGPVSEGLVAWGLGALALLIVIRLIGTKASE
jgi:ubiquinol-cytochrome c reductase cytochrome c subunit